MTVRTERQLKFEGRSEAARIARSRKALLLADLLDSNAGDLLDDLLADDGAVLRSMPTEWWAALGAEVRVGVPSPTTVDEVVVNLQRRKISSTVDPFEGIAAPAASSVNFVGCDR